ncbi:MAG TPA: rhodanese-like domain-containing protein [Halothiobacillus sp.]|nr:rhodanese-like domain-containing protein [Halothiobacillus sp.]
MFWRIVVSLGCLLVSSMTWANNVKLDAKRDSLLVIDQGQVITVQRIQDLSNEVTGFYARTSRPCPHFCIQPHTAAPGVETVSEIEVFDFMEGPLARGEGVLIDNRLESFYRKGTIPGSIHIPFTVFEKDPSDPELVAALESLGAIKRDGVSGVTRMIERIGLFGGRYKTDNWDFSRVKTVLMWCNGPWCDQSPHAIRALLDLGFPADRILYYRGGMQMWQLFGLTTVVPTSAEN